MVTLDLNTTQYVSFSAEFLLKTNRVTKIQQSSIYKPTKTQNFDNTLHDRLVHELKWKAQQDSRPVVKCEVEDLENVYTFNPFPVVRFMGSSTREVDNFQLHIVKWNN